MRRNVYEEFQSTLPSQGATNRICRKWRSTDISIHAPLTGSDLYQGLKDDGHVISIHAPLTGSDKQQEEIDSLKRISIHAPLTGSDLYEALMALPTEPFQSTLPSQGATHAGEVHGKLGHRFQSTLPSQGATHPIKAKQGKTFISIHAPLTGSDLCEQL